MQRTVQDVMTRDVVVAHESTPFHELVELLSRHHVRALPVLDAARRLHAHRVDQLPVVDHGGVLAGIISRFDVLKVFLRSDEEIRFELLDDIAGRLLRLPAHRLQVDVDGGVVTLAGRLERRSQAFGLAQLAGLVDGVVAVRDRLTYELDDLGTKAATTAR